MNILYMAFIYACVAAIICGAVFVVRMTIKHVFKGRKLWSARPYWFIIAICAAVFVAKAVGMSAGNQMAHEHSRFATQQNAPAQIDYKALYEYCIKSVGAAESQMIKKMSGVDFCACVAEETLGNITPKASDKAIFAAAEAATKKCENRIDKALSKKGL